MEAQDHAGRELIMEEASPALPVDAGPKLPGPSQRGKATTWPPAVLARPGLALGHPGTQGSASGNPRGSFGRKSKPLQQESGPREAI